MCYFTLGESIKKYYNFWDENKIWFESEAIRAFTFIVPVRVNSFCNGSMIITILYCSFISRPTEGWNTMAVISLSCLCRHHAKRSLNTLVIVISYYDAHILLLAWHRLLDQKKEKKSPPSKAGVMPKEGWLRRPPILLLVWQQLSTQVTFLSDTVNITKLPIYHMKEIIILKQFSEQELYQ